MHYAILTKLGKGKPFKTPTDVSAPGEPLHLDESATLVAFHHQPHIVFARQYAQVCGYILWTISEMTLHPDEYEPAETFEYYREFQSYIHQQLNLKSESALRE